ncbi:hypothetical protein [Cryobacterium tagatosivorans]|uniref:ATP-binding protein n=1 Tax=Cryobacterium tagatosivorans TaxID=1259199 RepID=A0A4R8UE41_9MICO|nr:hypothetical protein [Cryobacterium tagatosivorans]TFB47776.1 hypothetical protein E3O23_14300 [Cryobacterium tagatosivorans]
MTVQTDRLQPAAPVGPDAASRATAVLASPGTRARIRPASERLARTLFAGLGVTALCFGALSADSFFHHIWSPAPELATAAWLVFFAVPILVGISSFWAPLRVLRGFAIGQSVFFFLIIGFWLVFRAEPLPAGADIPWVISYTAGPTMAIAVIAADRVAWVHMAGVCLASGLLRSATSADPNPALVGVQDGLYALLALTVFVGLFTVTRQRAASVDAAEVVANADVAAAAARVARTRERLTIDALVHDGVISTLLMAGHGRVPTRVLSRHAADTLIRLDALRAPVPGRPVSGAELEHRLERLTAELAPDATVRSNLDGDLEVPAVAANALLGAVGEALRNSEAAADGAGIVSSVVRTVIVQARAGGIRVEVLDDGVGFDLSAVPPERLGISESIIGRMQRVAGGSAAVRSWPGAGTEVVVSWTP